MEKLYIKPQNLQDKLKKMESRLNGLSEGKEKEKLTIEFGKIKDKLGKSPEIPIIDELHDTPKTFGSEELKKIFSSSSLDEGIHIPDVEVDSLDLDAMQMQQIGRVLSSKNNNEGEGLDLQTITESIKKGR